MNIKRIRELVDIMNDNGLTEVEIEQEGVKVKLVKRPSGVVEQVVAPTVVTGGTKTSAQPLESAAGGNLKEVKAPMVGTFYRAPAPDVEPYVEIGDTVQKGDVLCIVEAMKLMNEVKAEFGGKVVEICVENAEPVEFGQVLFRIEPA